MSNKNYVYAIRHRISVSKCTLIRVLSNIFQIMTQISNENIYIIYPNVDFGDNESIGNEA